MSWVQASGQVLAWWVSCDVIAARVGRFARSELEALLALGDQAHERTDRRSSAHRAALWRL